VFVDKGKQALDGSEFHGVMAGFDLMKIGLLLARRLPSEIALPKVEDLCKFFIQLLKLEMTLMHSTEMSTDVPSVSTKQSNHEGGDTWLLKG
jgi:hypothetical protein